MSRHVGLGPGILALCLAGTACGLTDGTEDRRDLSGDAAQPPTAATRPSGCDQPYQKAIADSLGPVQCVNDTVRFCVGPDAVDSPTNEVVTALAKAGYATIDQLGPEYGSTLVRMHRDGNLVLVVGGEDSSEKCCVVFGPDAFIMEPGPK